MKIKCTNIILNGNKTSVLGASNGGLTVGKKYIVLVIYIEKDGIGFQIECDDGELTIPDGDQFEILSSYIPSCWEITFKTKEENSYFYVKLAPKKWNQARFEGETAESYKPNFYEAIVDVNTPLEGLEGWRNYPSDQIPEVVKLYFQEKDIIYKEEEAYGKSSAAGNKTNSILLNLIKGCK